MVLVRFINLIKEYVTLVLKSRVVKYATVSVELTVAIEHMVMLGLYRVWHNNKVVLHTKSPARANQKFTALTGVRV
jgi:hypothetical protein